MIKINLHVNLYVFNALLCQAPVPYALLCQPTCFHDLLCQHTLQKIRSFQLQAISCTKTGPKTDKNLARIGHRAI